MPTYIESFEYQVLTDTEKASVRRHRPYVLVDIPKQWQDCKEYENFRNDQHDLCGYAEFTNKHGTYLKTTVL